ncbi:MAG TPA: hypothetical protein DCQ33_13675 [Nitrospira sp.]|nr:hypothetical protein [Nitrospira sp.]
MPLRILFQGTVPKHLDSPEENEDAYSSLPEQGRIVVSDGASESFDAKSWSRLLVEKFSSLEPSIGAYEECIRAFDELHDPSGMSWSKAAAYERGSYGTLLIAQDRPDDHAVAITAIGDSFAVLSDGQTLLELTPYSASADFKQNPTLIATRSNFNTLLESAEVIACKQVVWHYEASGYRILLCMTDALGAWLLMHQEQNDPSALERLLSIREVDELTELVESERAKGTLRRDDSTLITAALTSGS